MTPGARQPQPQRGPPPPPPGYGPAYYPPHETFVFAQQQAPREGLSITRLTVPALLVCSLGAFLIAATYLATSQFADIKHAIDKLSNKIETLTGELSARIGRVEEDQAHAKREGWSRRDHEVWCAKAERANQRIGWTCSEESAAGPIARYGSPQVNGWSAKVKP